MSQHDKYKIVYKKRCKDLFSREEEEKKNVWTFYKLLIKKKDVINEFKG